MMHGRAEVMALLMNENEGEGIKICVEEDDVIKFEYILKKYLYDFEKLSEYEMKFKIWNDLGNFEFQVDDLSNNIKIINNGLTIYCNNVKLNIERLWLQK